jgi:hypothetical protein
MKNIMSKAMEIINVHTTKMVFPNPFTFSTTFSFIEDGNYLLEIFDITGKKIDFIRFSGKQFIYENNMILSGVYYYEIRNELGKYAQGILIKD